ncbi:MAG: AAA family ATPase [Burkholderiales bacterium]
MQTIDQWLSALGLSQYAESFERHDIRVGLLSSLTDQDLRELGVNSLGHRKTLLIAASHHRNDHEAPLSAPKAIPSSATEGERRQLTVMFCDMVGFTELANRVDPEVLQGIIRTYEDACAVCITRYEGYVFQRLGDGIVAFFGFPLAHEGEAERAIHAGLSIIDSLSCLDVPEVGHLQVRIGIATGLVVVSSAEKGAVGETMNLASRLQGIAPVGGIVVSERVRQLAGGRFLYENLGEQSLKGIARPTSAYRVLGASEIASRFEAATQEGLTPMVGREQEIGLLMDKWNQAREGEGQAVLLSGEPGIGKSRILSALRERLEAEGAQALRFQCSPYHGNSAFYPSIDNLERALKFARDETPQSKLGKLEALVVTHYGRPKADVRFLAAMLSIPAEERYGTITMTPQRFKDETLRALVDLTEAAARKHPSVMLFEDAHWADPTSLEVLDLLIDRVKSFPLLIVMIHRPEFHNRWGSHGHVAALNLSKLTKAQSSAIVSELAKNKTLPGNLLEQILTKTDGVPLFVEELTKAILESKDIEEKEDRYEYTGDPSTITIPATLRDSLMARLDRNQAVKEIAQIGAAIGREFSYELIQAVTPKTQTQLDEALQRLTDSGLAFRRGTPPEATYTFKHALVQDAAYDTLLKSRRKELHAQIAKTLIEKFDEEVAVRPAFVAHHYTEAGLPEEALQHWTRAGQLALQRSANVEAITYFTKGRDLLALISPSEANARRELGLWLGLWPAYMATRGFSTSEVEQAALRARELCEQLGEAEGAALALLAKFVVHLVRSEFRQARDEADAGLRLALRINDQQLVALMNLMIGDVCYWEGQFGASMGYLKEALIPWDLSKAKPLTERTGLDAHCIGLAYVAHNEFAMGYPGRSEVAMAESLRDAEILGNAQTSGHCLGLAGWLAVFKRDIGEARQLAARTIEYCREQRLMFWEASGYLVDGWVMIQDGKVNDGIRRVHEGIGIRRAAGAALVHSSFYAVLAECHGRAGEFDTGLALIAEGLAHVESSGERTSESELLRVQGELLLPKSLNVTAATQAFERAINVARHQDAKLFELRATQSLARLWRSQGKRKEAYDLLAPVYRWFTEGFDTKDLKAAKALLAELS